MASVADLMQVIADELDLDTGVAKIERLVLAWMNAVYRNVVRAEEFSWRKQDATILTRGAGYFTGTFTYGSAIVTGVTSTSNIGAEWENNFLKLRSAEEAIYQMTDTPAATIHLSQVYPGATGTYTCDVYCPRYEIAGIRQDWVTGVYCEDEEFELTRIHPNNFMEYIRYTIKNPSTPQFYYFEGKSDAGDELIGFAPAPDAQYSMTVKTLIGPETLTASTSSTILPPDFEEDIFRNGVGLLHSVSKKDAVGREFYGAEFGRVLSDLVRRENKEPGMVKRMMGYTIRDSGIKDPDVPIEWTL